MFIYNVTINIDETVHKEWLDWMKNEHIPNMLATKKFSKALMSRVLVEEEMFVVFRTELEITSEQHA